MTTVAEYLVKQAHRHGVVLWVDGDVKCFPAKKVTEPMKRLMQRHYHELKAWIVTDAVTQE